MSTQQFLFSSQVTARTLDTYYTILNLVWGSEEGQRLLLKGQDEKRYSKAWGQNKKVNLKSYPHASFFALGCLKSTFYDYPPATDEWQFNDKGKLYKHYLHPCLKFTVLWTLEIHPPLFWLTKGTKLV